MDGNDKYKLLILSCLLGIIAGIGIVAYSIYEFVENYVWIGGIVVVSAAAISLIWTVEHEEKIKYNITV